MVGWQFGVVFILNDNNNNDGWLAVFMRILEFFFASLVQVE